MSNGTFGFLVMRRRVDRVWAVTEKRHGFSLRAYPPCRQARRRANKAGMSLFSTAQPWLVSAIGSASRLTQCQRSPRDFMWRCSHEHRARSVVPFVTRAVLSLHEVGLLVVFRLNGAPRIPRDPDRGPSIANAPRGVVYGACARCLQP